MVIMSGPSNCGEIVVSMCHLASLWFATILLHQNWVYDYISGFHRDNEDGSTTLENGRLELFRNFNEHGDQLGRPNTLLIDSEQLESGEALDKKIPADMGNLMS